MAKSGSPQISILQIAESSAVHKILLKLFQRFSHVSHWFCVENPSPSFFRARWNSVLHGNQAAEIESNITVESFDSTVMLDPISETWSPGDEPGDPV